MSLGVPQKSKNRKHPPPPPHPILFHFVGIRPRKLGGSKINLDTWEGVRLRNIYFGFFAYLMKSERMEGFRFHFFDPTCFTMESIPGGFQLTSSPPPPQKK